jgi:phosphoribosylaminoimidazole-succinocarboxamide synthase
VPLQADTKFEFAVDEETDEIYLVDEVLTYVPIHQWTIAGGAVAKCHVRPDSSRFWSKADYEGTSPHNFLLLR